MRESKVHERLQGGALKNQPKGTTAVMMQPVGISASLLTLQRTYGNQTTARAIRSGSIQTRLAISNPEDPYEREADIVADQIMRMQRPDVSMQPGRHRIRRLCGECEENLHQIEHEETVHRQTTKDEEEEKLERQIGEDGDGERSNANRGGSLEVRPSLEARIESMRGGGQPLPEPARRFFEPRFGYDFSHVRIHTDGDAAEAARAVNAHAFTLGSDIVFGAGKYSPHSNEGALLLAHELTHTVQQTGRLQMKGDNVIQRLQEWEEEQDEQDEQHIAINVPEVEPEEKEMELESEATEECEDLINPSVMEPSSEIVVARTPEIQRSNGHKPKKKSRTTSIADCFKDFGRSPKQRRFRTGSHKSRSRKHRKNSIRCVTKYDVNQRQILTGSQPDVKNKETNRDFSLNDPNCVYLIQWDMKNIPDRIIITDNNNGSLLLDTGMVSGTGQQPIQGPANIHIRVVPNDGTQNPNNADTVYQYSIIEICGQVKKTVTCYWLGVIPFGQTVQSIPFVPAADYSTIEEWVTRSRAKRLLRRR